MEEVKNEDWFKEQFKELKHEDWFKEQFGQASSMNHLLARHKSSSSLRRKNSESSSATPSDQKPREAKSLQYTRPSYETELATKGSFMRKSELGITDASQGLCRTLFDAKQTVPQDTLFRDDLFDETCDSVHGRNEAMVVRDITPLICPSAQVLKIYGAKHLKHLTECVNEGWNSAISVYGSRPQPDFSVGFGRSAFTDEQLGKLKPFVGEIADSCTSYFMATWRMYFPFLTCEVKCGATGLDVADRQNAHSMTLAVRLSHDHRSVRIYGHYATIVGDKTSFYRHPIHEFSFSALEGEQKWRAYNFIMNVYDIFMPAQLKRISSAIDELPPDIDFSLSAFHNQLPFHICLNFKALSSQPPSRSLNPRKMTVNPVSVVRGMLHPILPYLREPSDRSRNRRTTLLQSSRAEISDSTGPHLAERS